MGADGPTGLTYEDVGRMTLPQMQNLWLRGKAADHGAAFATFADYARYRSQL